MQKYYFWGSIDRWRTIQIVNFRKFRRRIKDDMESDLPMCKNIIFGEVLIIQEQSISNFPKFS